jgi:hypothetical protein
MKRRNAPGPANAFAVTLIVAAMVAAPAVATAQAMVTMQQKIAQAQQLILVNKQQLARYVWQTQETISVNGDVKSQDLYQVAVSPTGQQVRQLVAQPVAQPAGRKHGIKHRIADNMKAYAQAVGELAKSYSPLDAARVQQLAAQGSVAVRSGGGPNFVAIVISNYNKPGDAITATFSVNPKALVAATVATYNEGPGDPVAIQVRYATLPDGTRYPATLTVNAPAMGLTIADQNMNFTPRQQ